MNQFWDVDVKKLNPKKSTYFIISRTLEHGDIQQVKDVLVRYSPDTIKEVVKKTSELSPRIANFWSIYFNLPKKEILCLKRSYLKRRRKLWAY